MKMDSFTPFHLLPLELLQQEDVGLFGEVAKFRNGSCEFTEGKGLSENMVHLVCITLHCIPLHLRKPNFMDSKYLPKGPYFNSGSQNTSIPASKPPAYNLHVPKFNVKL